MKKTALITGITGQDGAYLADFLLKKGLFVFMESNVAPRYSIPTGSIISIRILMFQNAILSFTMVI